MCRFIFKVYENPSIFFIDRHKIHTHNNFDIFISWVKNYEQRFVNLNSKIYENSSI
jgi:hypothetical protein